MRELAAALRAASSQALRGLHTCMPGVIVAYDAGKQLADVQPSLSRRLKDGRDEKLPILTDVPVIWPRSGGASMTFPVDSGDGCLLMFSERSIDTWKGADGENFTDDTRMFDLSDAVAIMGLVQAGKAGAPGNKVRIKFGETTIDVADGEVEMKAPKVKIDAPDTQIVGNVAITGNLGVSGESTSQGSLIINGNLDVNGGALRHQSKNVGRTHRHSGVQTGGGNTGEPT